MVSSLLSCWTVRVRLASRPGLLLLLGDGNDGDDEDGKAEFNLQTPTISGQKGFDPAGSAADNLDLQAVGLLPPRRGATKINLQKATCRKGYAEKDLQPQEGQHGDLLPQNGDEYDAEIDLPQPQIEGRKEKQGSAPAKNGPLPVTLGALLLEPEDISVDEGACEERAAEGASAYDAESAADEDACAHAVDGGDVTAPDEDAHSDLLLMNEDPAEDAAIEFSPDEEDAASAAADEGLDPADEGLDPADDGLDPAAADEGLDPQPVKIGQITVENQGFHPADKDALQPNPATIGGATNQIALQGEFFPFSIDESCLHAGEIWKLSFLKRLRAAIQKLAYDTLAYADVIITHAMPRIDPKVKKKKTSLLLCVTINMPFHPGEHEVSHETVAGHAPREGEDHVHADHVGQDEADFQDARVYDVCRFHDAAHLVVILADCSHDGMVLVVKAGTLSTYLPFPILRGSKGIYQDSEKQIEVPAKLVQAGLKMKTKMIMLLIIQATLDPG